LALHYQALIVMAQSNVINTIFVGVLTMVGEQIDELFPVLVVISWDFPFDDEPMSPDWF
jgi:hypothetical protein